MNGPSVDALPVYALMALNEAMGAKHIATNVPPFEFTLTCVLMENTDDVGDVLFHILAPLSDASVFSKFI